LLFGRARLFLDRIELTGFRYNDQYQERITLNDVERIEWRMKAHADPNVVFHLTNGNTTAFTLNQIKLWKHTLEHRIRWNRPVQYAPIPAHRGHDGFGE